MTATDELSKHEQRVAVAQQRARALGRDLAEHNAKITELKQRKIDAHSREDEQLATKVRKQIDAAAAKIIDLEERQAGAQLAASRADSERDTWRVAHFRELLDEVGPDAHAAAESLVAKIDEVESARQHWHAVRHRIAALVEGVPGISPKAIPSIDATDSAIRELRKGVGPILPPLPRGELSAAVVVPMHDPDPAVREPARAAIKEKAGKGA